MEETKTRCKNIRIKLHLRSSSILWLYKSIKRYHWKAYANVVQIRYHGRCSITNIRKCQNQQNAIFAFKKMWEDHIWVHVNPVRKLWKFVQNVLMLILKSKSKFVSMKWSKKSKMRKMKEKWMSFWKLLKKDQEELWRDYSKKEQSNGALS